MQAVHFGDARELGGEGKERKTGGEDPPIQPF